MNKEVLSLMQAQMRVDALMETNAVAQRYGLMLTLDYPVLRDLSALSGVERIHAYLQCIEMEQERLGQMGEAAVIAAMERYDPDGREGFDNLYGIVLQSAY